jgi:hypothetical protein
MAAHWYWASTYRAILSDFCPLFKASFVEDVLVRAWEDIYFFRLSKALIADGAVSIYSDYLLHGCLLYFQIHDTFSIFFAPNDHTIKYAK